MWQSQPQKKRPKISVLRIATMKNTAPALTTPTSRVSMLSLGSMGDTVMPMMAHWIRCAIMSIFTSVSTPARQRAILVRPIIGALLLPQSSTGSETDRATPASAAS